MQIADRKLQYGKASTTSASANVNTGTEYNKQPLTDKERKAVETLERLNREADDLIPTDNFIEIGRLVKI